MLVLRHNLDIMHIEKKHVRKLISKLLQVKRKSKDHLNARLDLEDMGLKPLLHPVQADGVPT